MIELWCNGNTADFGSVIPSSSLGSSTEEKEAFESLFSFCCADMFGRQPAGNANERMRDLRASAGRGCSPHGSASPSRLFHRHRGQIVPVGRIVRRSVFMTHLYVSESLRGYYYRIPPHRSVDRVYRAHQSVLPRVVARVEQRGLHLVTVKLITGRPHQARVQLKPWARP